MYGWGSWSGSEPSWRMVSCDETLRWTSWAWSLPAGFVNSDETSNPSCVSEVKEETGVSCKLLQDDWLSQWGNPNRNE